MRVAVLISMVVASTLDGRELRRIDNPFKLSVGDSLSLSRPVSRMPFTDIFAHSRFVRSRAKPAAKPRLGLKSRFAGIAVGVRCKYNAGDARGGADTLPVALSLSTTPHTGLKFVENSITELEIQEIPKPDI